MNKERKVEINQGKKKEKQKNKRRKQRNVIKKE